MANPSISVAENVAGDFFVDATCIDCDTCRQLAPAVLGPGPSLKVGICWQGNPRFAGDRLRSARLEQFLPLAKVPGVRSGVPQTTAFDRLLDALRSAHAEREAAGRDMEALAPAERATHAADLVARYGQASRERSEALARLTAWLTEQESTAPPAAPAAPGR